MDWLTLWHIARLWIEGIIIALAVVYTLVALVLLIVTVWEGLG